MESIKIETRISEKDYTKLMLSIAYKRPSLILLSILGFVFLVLAILGVLISGLSFESQYLVLFIFGFVYVFLWPLLIYFSAKRNFKHNRIKETITYEFDNEKIKSTGESFKTEFDWGNLYKIKELKDWILLYQSKRLLNPIPIKDMSNKELQDLKTLIRSIPSLNSKLKS